MGERPAGHGPAPTASAAAAASPAAGDAATAGAPVGAGAGLWVRVVLVGALAGLTSGLFGVGGGTVIVPALMGLAGFVPKLATGTSLTAIVPIAVSGTVGYATSGEVDWAVAVALTAGALGGAILGTHLLRRIDATSLQMIFAAVLLVTAGRMAVGTGGGTGRPDLDAVAVAGLVLVGVGAGLLAGLLGVGGGILIVPALSLGLGFPLALAKGTSLAVIVPTAVAGTIRNRSAGLAALGPGAVVGGAGIVSAFAASQISIGLDEQLAAALFAGLLAVVAIRLLRTARRDRAPGRVAG